MKSGAVSFNGKPITLDQLRGELADIKSKNGVIWYYREAAAHEVGPPIADQVIQLVVENRLPISFSTEPDYTNFVDPNGTVKPRIVASLPGSPAPQDIFEPHMPAVDVLSNMDAVFAKAREQSAAGRQVVVVPPGRILMSAPGPAPGNPLLKKAAEHAKSVLHSNPPLNISVVAYTKLEALLQDKVNPTRSVNICIPFFGHLISFAYAGHTLVVFEGHRSAFEAGGTQR
jgi:hypothetical protein